MPPKRKNKATKAPATTPPKASPAAIRASSIVKRRNSLQGAKTSRLAPSEPLHMTTRRAAKTASNHNSPAAPSLSDSSSRRSSLNDFAQYEDARSEIEDERPAKRARLSTDTGSRRASTDSLADHIAVNGAQTPDSQPKPASRTSSDDSKSSSKKRRASDESIQSSKAVSARTNGVLTRTQGDISEQQPRRKKRKTTQAAEEAADQPPELTDGSTTPNSPERIAAVEGSQNLHHVLPTNGDAPAKTGRRLPGRRRAPHPDINVETDLRRQLNLKMSYRSLAKVQKSLLEELSNRTTNSLENDPDYYKKCPEYEPLMAALDEHKERRLSQVKAQRSEKLEQLERVRVATEHIERQKYLQRFRDLQDDLLLQCFYRLKQIEREAKGEDGAATEDEENIIPATRIDFPAHGQDDRLVSKFASRSRAYVETERLVDEEIVRKQFDEQRKAFVAQNEEADDSIEDIPGGFANFVGPDRAEAIAHRNIMNLADAATKAEIVTAIPNEQADALFVLASLSAERPRGEPLEEKNYPPPQAMPLAQVSSPVPQDGLDRQTSPAPPFSIASTTMSLETAQNTPVKAPQGQTVSIQITPRPDANGLQPANEVEAPKSETPARVSTHRIMDLLNDSDVPVPRSRESHPPAHEQPPGTTPSRRENTSHAQTPSRGGLPGLDAIISRQEPAADQSGSSAKEGSLPPLSGVPPSSPSANRFWLGRAPSAQSHQYEESLRRRDPFKRIREMLDNKARAMGKPLPSERPDNPENIHKAATERENSLDKMREMVDNRAERPDNPANIRNAAAPVANERQQGQMGAPLLSRPFSPSGTREKQESAGKDAQNPSTGGYVASPSMAPISYHQSPSMVPAYAHPPRHGSQDQGAPYWERDRRLSGSQVSQPPAPSHYAGSPQPYQTDPTKPAPTPPTHQSPYPPPSGPQLPPFSQSLPPKPPGPPPSGPINFRFAHYDPAPPPRSAYPPASYPPASHPSPHGGPPPPPHYGQAYSGPPSYQGGYVPPPGSFQAPPPPPPNMQYPPLKIHQYGGQPILPANMAPLPHSQPPPMTYMGQGPPPPAYSPPQQNPMPQRNQSYEQPPPSAPRDSPAERSSDSQSRQRRQYRSYHAPGTQFRSYQGPDSGGRRRGG